MAQTALLGLSGLYVGDYLSARYRIPDDRQTLGSVQVKTLYAVRQKSGRIEYSLGDTETEPCVRSLFPHLGYIPCWYLGRHATKRIEIGRAIGKPFGLHAGNPIPARSEVRLPGGRRDTMAECRSSSSSARSRGRGI